MRKLIDETGNKYGEWIILNYIKPKDRAPENKDLSYLAKCSCGTIRPVRIGDLRNGKSKSCGCLKKKNWNIEIGKTYGEVTVIEQLTNRHGNLIQKYKCKCSCGKEVLWPADLINKKKNCGCQFMKGFDVREDLVGQKFGKLTVTEMSEKLDKYGKRSYAICRCDCGNICEVYRGHLKDGHTSSCGCTESFGEEYVSSFLKEKGISFKRQYRFSDLIDKKELPFDIAILKENTVIGLIEIQGKQHYDSSLLFYSEDLIKHDKMKEEYCYKNQIPFLRLDYRKGKQNFNQQDWNNQLLTFLKENTDYVL